MKLQYFFLSVTLFMCEALSAEHVGEKSDLLTQFGQEPAVSMSEVHKIVFAVRSTSRDPHWYANFGYYADDEKRLPFPVRGGKLCQFDIDTKEIKTMLDDSEGAVRDPQVHYNGQKIIFSYRPGGTSYYHLYEINTDGTGMKQLTHGDFDDIEPSYTADGQIIFVSSRAKRWVNCWLTQVAILYGCDANGGNLHALSGNIEQDNTPWPLPNGQILYTRWEYVDRSQVDFHHLWTMYPDGSKQMVYFGNMNPGTVFIDAKPIPNSEKIVASFSWGHGNAEHAGSIGIIDPRWGPDEQKAAKRISKESNYRDPWAFSESSFMAAKGSQIIWMDGEGNEQTLLDLPDAWKEQKMLVHEPRPIIEREPEPIVHSAMNPAQSNGRMILTDIYQGRNMEGVERGEIKKLLILETLPKPINFTGGMEPLTYGGSFTLERIIGTVPVEEDGSAHFELPSMRSFFFVALDKNDIAVKRMQSFLSLMPGELTSCIGCHESRTSTPKQTPYPMAVKRAPSPVTPIADFRGMDGFGNSLASTVGIPDVIDYPRDVQPVLDAHCIQCHSPEKRNGGVSLTGDRTPLYTVSYYTITAKQLVADGRNLPKGNYPPRTLGSGASRLIQLCDGSHHGATLTDREKTLIRLWCETGATYPGTYAGLGSGMVGGYAENQIDRRDLEWPEIKAMQKTLLQNCAACHTKEKNMQLPLSPSDETGGPPWENMSPNDVRRKYSRQLLYNLTNPDKSTLLLAALSKKEGGYESCGSAILKDKKDPRYKTILAGIERTKQYLDEIKRFDMPGFTPRTQYIRELKKYAILPPEHNPETAVDTYELEQKYWQSLWYKP
jgi:mono/diheme cytochrome c family protein